MPKISNNQVTIYKETIKLHYTVVIMYNQNNMFYAVVPEEFNEHVKHLTDDERKTLYVSYERTNSRLQTKESSRFIICAETEQLCLERWKTAIKILAEKKIEKRNVIIIHFIPNNTTSYGSMSYNREHTQIGLQFGLAYALETKSGDTKNYKRIHTHKDNNGNEHTSYQDMSIYRGSCTVIDDTEENRLFLNNLYNALKNLHDKLKDYTSTSESILQLIQSGTKLIGQ